jgi:transposase InsO family protein
MLAETGIASVKLPPRAPNLNAYAERFVRTIKEDCLDRMILFGEHSLRNLIQHFSAHYHFERNHQGLGNRIITPNQMIGPHNGNYTTPATTRRTPQVLLPRGAVIAVFFISARNANRLSRSNPTTRQKSRVSP